MICAFGRLGTTFACDKFGYVPDMITCAKGMTSGYSPIGAIIASDRIMEPFLRGDDDSRTATPSVATRSARPSRWPTSTCSRRRASTEHVLDTEEPFVRPLRSYRDLPIVGDVRGDGYFYGIELVKDKATRETFNDDESERLLRGFLFPAPSSTPGSTAAPTTAATR